MELNNYTETPSNRTETEYKNLENIKQRASVQVSNAQVTRNNIQEEGRKESLLAEEAQKDPNHEGELAMNIAAEAVGVKAVMELGQLVGERMDAARGPSAAEESALGGFIGGAVQTIDEFARGGKSLNERCNITSQSLTGESAADDGFQVSAKGVRGVEEGLTYTTQFANQRNYEAAIRMQQEYEANMSGQVYARGMAPGGMNTMQRHDLALNKFGPKPPNFKTVDEDATNWGAGSVTG